MRVNQKLERIQENTIVGGIDIAKKRHYVRFVDYRGSEIHKVISFSNDKAGFEKLMQEIARVKEKTGKDDIIIGYEPTGHYWLNLHEYLETQNVEGVIVSTYATKQAKEFDDNSPTKSDPKDALVIARLVSEGRYSKPIVREGIYKDIASGNSILNDITKEIVKVKNQIHRWNDMYFPELESVYDINSKECEIFYELGLTPDVIREIKEEELIELLRENNNYASKNKIIELKELADVSVGIKIDNYTVKTIQRLIKKLKELNVEKEELTNELIEIINKIEYVSNVVEITGIGYPSMIGIVAEAGDLNNYNHYKQLMKMAGLGLKENSSGTKKGKKRINRRGRSQLRRTLKLAALSLIRHNDTFNSLHIYYTQRRDRKLEKLVSVNAVIHKFVRILMAIVKSSEKFSKEKMIRESCISYS